MPSTYLGHHQSELKKLLAGTNPRINPEKMLKTTPPGHGSLLLNGIEEVKDALGKFLVSEDALSILSIGGQTDEDTGVRCYHSKTGVVELLLNHTVDHLDECIVVDMTAGADAFASGLYDKFDLTIVVVEPTKKSLSVWKEYGQKAKSLGVNVMAVGNKVIDERDKEFLKTEIGTDLIGCLEHSAYIRGLEKGSNPIRALEESNRQVLKVIAEQLRNTPKDWSKYLERSKQIHRLNAQSWGNKSVGEDAEQQIDDSFSYPV